MLATIMPTVSKYASSTCLTFILRTVINHRSLQVLFGREPRFLEMYCADCHILRVFKELPTSLDRKLFWSKQLEYVFFSELWSFVQSEWKVRRRVILLTVKGRPTFVKTHALAVLNSWISVGQKTSSKNQLLLQCITNIRKWCSTPW